jgi:hypothetical protein
MNKNYLFAIDDQTNEVVISESPKGSMKINFIERLSKKENEILYSAVLTLTSITKEANFNANLFKAMDKVCQLIYTLHKELK